MKLKSIFLVLLLLPLAGCTTMLKADKIITVKQRFFGFGFIYNPATQAPEIYLGWGSTIYQMIPTSTNAPVNAPRYFDTFNLGQTGVNPFSTEIIENTGTGDVAVGTNGMGGAILPKLPLPPKKIHLE